MRIAGRLKLGFYPLPVKEAECIRVRLQYPDEFAAVDPCVGDGVAFSRLLESTKAHAWGIEIDAFRSEQTGKLGVQVIQANAMDVRCPAESMSLDDFSGYDRLKSHGFTHHRINHSAKVWVMGDIHTKYD
jgi:hypothetical protein